MIHEINGHWANDIMWKISVTNKLPDKNLVTAIFCIAINSAEQIILARSRRGWGILGGHIEAEEEIEEALIRESIEEGGFTPSNPRLFAVMKINPKYPVLKPNSDSEYYPYPDSYQLYYWAKSNSPIAPPIGQEILESRGFSLLEIEQLVIPDYQIIDLGFKAYLSSK